MTRTTIRERLKLISIRKMLLPVLVFGVLYWMLDAMIDAFIFRETDFITSIIAPDAMCLLMRIVNIIIIAMFSLYAHMMLAKRKQVEAQQKELIIKLQDALGRVKILSGLLPICASCKRIRNDQGYWDRIEKYISEHTDAEFTHSLCHECVEKLYPKHYKKVAEKLMQEN